MQSLVDFVMGIVQLVIVLAVILALVSAWGYNSLRKLAENVKEAHSNIDVALRKKVSLVNQLIDVAAKYMDRESVVMLKVSQDTTEAATQQLYQQTGTVLSTLNGMAQKFPDLKASQQYTNLAEQIARSEDDVQNRRLQCNAAIKEYNSRRSALPHALYAGFLGFRAARYLELDTTESTDASVQKQIIVDDGDRLNELLGMASSRVMGATRTLASQGKVLAEKAATRVQEEIAARSNHADGARYTYLDEARAPRGPVSRGELDSMVASGTINSETDVLATGTSTWVKYSALTPPQA